MKCMRFALLPLLLIAWSGEWRLMSAPQAGGPQSLIRSIADSSWDGAMGDAAKGNSPAQLKIVLQKGNLTGFLAYDGYEETLSVTISAPSSIRLKGISYRDLQHGSRPFNLDTLSAELSQDGRRLTGTAIDTQGTRSRFEFRRTSAR